MLKFVQNLRADLSFRANNSHYQAGLAKILNRSTHASQPNELFSEINDDYWFWLNTHGYRTNQTLRNILPGTPDDDTQLMFTGEKGDTVLREGFIAYKLFRDLYTKYVGPINQCNNILDFGCGWGRIIRFFLKDLAPSNIHGCDPVEQMISICKEQNKWSNFTRINTRPPSPYRDNTFDLIYSFSVFSHLSEEMSSLLLTELTRILKPGGLLVVTTRSRDFITHCAKLRKNKNLDAIHAGPKSSAAAFVNTEESLANFDSGKYCFSQLVHEGEWSYWGDTAIPKQYVLDHWTKSLNFITYIDGKNDMSGKSIVQNTIAMQKPALMV